MKKSTITLKLHRVAIANFPLTITGGNADSRDKICIHTQKCSEYDNDYNCVTRECFSVPPGCQSPVNF